MYLGKLILEILNINRKKKNKNYPKTFSRDPLLLLLKLLDFLSLIILWTQCNTTTYRTFLSAHNAATHRYHHYILSSLLHIAATIVAIVVIAQHCCNLLLPLHIFTPTIAHWHRHHWISMLLPLDINVVFAKQWHYSYCTSTPSWLDINATTTNWCCPYNHCPLLL